MILELYFDYEFCLQKNHKLTIFCCLQKRRWYFWEDTTRCLGLIWFKICQNFLLMGQKTESSTKKLFWNLNKTKIRVELSKKSYCEELVKVKALMFVTAKVGSTVIDARGFLAQITTAMIYLHSQSQLLYQPFLMAFKGQIHYQHHR